VAERSDTKLSKFLSLVLRHEPGSIGIELDAQGWVEVDVLLRALAEHGHEVDRARLVHLVDTSDKRRFALAPDGSKIRANQGHSVDVELGYAPATPPEVLFHGTVARFLLAIREQGLSKGERHHVHLSATRDVAIQVGSRRGAPVVLEVAAGEMARSGSDFFLSENGVWLTAHVPPRFLTFP